jgi:hypothetical protein
MTMDLTRRGIVSGLFVSMAAPAIVRTPGLLMPVRNRHPIGMSGLVLFNPNGLSIEEPAYGPSLSIEECYQAIIDIANPEPPGQAANAIISRVTPISLISYMG